MYKAKQMSYNTTQTPIYGTVQTNICQKGKNIIRIDCIK